VVKVSLSDDYRRFEARVARDLAYVEAHQSPEHQVTAYRDMGKFFRSRNGSANYRGVCTCGWQSSKYYYDEKQARAGAARHLREVEQ